MNFWVLWMILGFSNWLCFGFPSQADLSDVCETASLPWLHLSHFSTNKCPAPTLQENEISNGLHPLTSNTYGFARSFTKVKADVNTTTPSHEKQFIVSMTSYEPIERHVSYVRDILIQLNAVWSHISRNNPAMKYPTDFIIVNLPSVTSNEDPILETLRDDHLIRYVTPQRKFASRGTLAIEEDDSYEGGNGDLETCNLAWKRHLRGGVAFSSFDKEELIPSLHRKLLTENSITDSYSASLLWDEGFTGQNVKIAVFDTGIRKSHPHFRNVIERTDWTDDNQLGDRIGHGTFVAGVIASQSDCLGFAPDAEIYAFRVFTNKRVSFTSWFLDAFNHAIKQKINVLNLSIGGPDFLDMPFVAKVNEMSENNIIVVSALGNDGPKWGTLNNPADQPDVIGVGGITYHHTIASFSSRGMTTWEIPHGYGRVKPDVVAYGKGVRGSGMGSGCRSLSGTSVASPVVAGAVVLLSSIFPLEKRYPRINPASMKQVLVETAVPISGAGIYEQGFGNLNLIGAYHKLKTYVPKASALPDVIDFTNCPYFYPFCSQELYYNSLPVLFNVTIQNGMSPTGYIIEPPVWTQTSDESAQLNVEFAYSKVIWPWSGYLGLVITVAEDRIYAADTIASGSIQLTVTSDQGVKSDIIITLKAKVITTPPRSKRLLWDQFHQLRYPSGYFPRDNLDIKDDLLDWHGDHLHTNFRDFYHVIRELGYYIEILGTDYTCFDATQYSTLIIVDTEDEFFANEIYKLEDDVRNKGLSIFVAAEWYNTNKMKNLKFFDENSNSWWTPLTGGSNVPALNDMLSAFGISLSDRIYKGELSVGDRHTTYSSGTSIARFPSHSYVITSDMRDVTATKPHTEVDVAVLGLHDLYQAMKATSVEIGNITDGTELFPARNRGEPIHHDSDITSSVEDRGGRIAVYGDSGCLDLSYREEECRWLIETILRFTSLGEIDSTVIQEVFYHPDRYESLIGNIPERLNLPQFAKESRTVSENAFPKCAVTSSLTFKNRKNEDQQREFSQVGDTEQPQDGQETVNFKQLPSIDQLPQNATDSDPLIDIYLFVVVVMITVFGFTILMYSRRLFLRRRSRHLPQYVN